MVAEFERIGGGTRHEPQPAFGAHAGDKRVTIFEDEHRAVEQGLIPRQGERDLLAGHRRRPQAAPGHVGARHPQDVHRAVMFEVMQALRETSLRPAAQNALDHTHTPRLRYTRRPARCGGGAVLGVPKPQGGSRQLPRS